jgi:hypothetical protein
MSFQIAGWILWLVIVSILIVAAFFRNEDSETSSFDSLLDRLTGR